MELHLTDPQALIEPSWLNSYTREIELIWHPIVELNTNLFILEKIMRFPFNLFEMEYTLFWKITKTTIYEKCLLIISNLTMDSLKASIAISKLKNNIRRHLINDDCRKLLDHELKQIGFEKSLKKLRSRIKNMRDKKIAHYDKEYLQNRAIPKMNEEAPPFDDLNTIRQKINELFNILCFSHKYSVEFIEYNPDVEHPPRTDARTDIEKILDNLAFNSPLLNMPEQQKEFWPHYRQNLSEDDIKIMNRYRRKFKLNPI